MSWLILVIAATFFDAIRIFLDNYTSDVYFKDKGAVSQKLFHAYTRFFTGIVILLLAGFSFDQASISIIFTFILTGVFSSLSGIPYYKALEIEESTNLGIFIQLAPILYLVLGCLFLGESFSLTQLLAIAIILAAPILIVTTTKKRSRHIKLRAIAYAFLYVLLAVIGNLIFVKTNSASLNNLNLFSEIALTLIGISITDFIIMFFHPKWRKRFHVVSKKSKKRVYIPLAFNYLVGLAKSFTWRIGLVAAPATALASVSSDSIEPIVIFFMGIILTLIWPKFGREKLDKKTVLVHLVATILVVCGIILIQV